MSTSALPPGAWLPDRHGVLKWHPGKTAPAWQNTAHSICGSMTGANQHHLDKTPPCDLCAAAERAYYERRKEGVR